MPKPDHLDELLCYLQSFSKDQRKKDRSDFEPDTMSSFQKIPASHWLCLNENEADVETEL